MTLPVGFPEDIEIYVGDSGPATVTDIAYQRSPGSADFLITFLTEDDQADVVDYYQREFASRGWTVTDATVPPSSFTLGIEFTDSNDELQGTLTADIFDKDSRYTQVDLLVFVSPTRGRGN
jgi:hypothetical protein